MCSNLDNKNTDEVEENLLIVVTDAQSQVADILFGT